MLKFSLLEAFELGAIEDYSQIKYSHFNTSFPFKSCLLGSFSKINGCLKLVKHRNTKPLFIFDTSG